MAVERALKGFADHSHAAAADLADDVEFSQSSVTGSSAGTRRNYQASVGATEVSGSRWRRRGRHPTISSDDDSRRLASVSHAAEAQVLGHFGQLRLWQFPRRNADSVAGLGHTVLFIGASSRRRP